MARTNSRTRAFIESITVKIVDDPDPDTSYLDQTGEGCDFSERKAEYERGAFSFVGVVADATIRVRTAQGGYGPAHTIRGGSLWGIESDSERSYFAEVGRECLNELRDQLGALECDTSDFEAKAAEALANL